MTDHDPRDDVDQPATQLIKQETSTVALMLRAEIDSRVATARQYPRDVRLAIKNINTLATIDEDTAAANLYALVRKKKKKGRGDAATNDEENKAIEGPSIRLAQTAAQCWGNCDYGARVINVNRIEKWLEAEGFFHDLETNARNTDIVRRRIATTSGYLFSEDMINVTGRAACAIAKRNAILGGVLRAAYWGAYQASREMVAGTHAQLSVNRDKAIAAFAAYGVTPEQILETLDLEDVGEIKLDHIATLRAMFMSIKNGEATVEEMFAKEKPAAGDSNHNPLVKPSGQDQQQQGGENEVAEKHEEGQTRPADASQTENRPAAAQEGGKTGEKPVTDSAATGDASKDAAAKASDKPAPSDAGPSAGDAASAQPDLLADAAAAPKSNGPDKLESYHKALLSIESGGPAKLLKQAQAWGNKHGEFDAGATKARDTIYALHVKRLTGEIAKDDCIKQVTGLLPK